MTPTLIQYSRNARAMKDLVRRPHVDQHGCPSKREVTGGLGTINCMGDGRSMHVVKGILATPYWGKALARKKHFAIYFLSPNTP
jgi:hypothetical protein